MKKTATLHENAEYTYLVLEFDPASDGWFLYAHTSPETPPALEMWHMSEEDAREQALQDWGVNDSDWKSESEENASTKSPTLDANGTALADGDTITLIKDLDVKGTSTTLKRGMTIKNIRLTDDPAEIDCPSAPVRGLVLKSCFVKKIA